MFLIQKVSNALCDLFKFHSISPRHSFAVSLSLEVKSQGKSTSIVLIKSKDLPLDATRPMSAQIQVASVMSDAKGEEEVKSSAYLQNMHQFTRHFLAPIARSIRANTHVTTGLQSPLDSAAHTPFTRWQRL